MRCVALLVVAICSAGCVKTIALSSEIEPARAASVRSSERAGVVCREGLLGHVERAHPSTVAGFATTYAFELGEPLCGALFRSVEGTYRVAQRATTLPYKGEYPRVVAFDLQNSSLHILPQGNGSTRVVYTVSVVVERYGRDLQQLGRNVVTGNRLVDCDEVSDRVVKEVIEAALQQVADGASELLVARLDGPRQFVRPAEEAPAAPRR